MRSILLPLIPAVLLLAACDGKPSAGHIEDLLNETIEQQGAGDLFHYSDCEQTNGIEQANNTYVASMTCTLKFLKSRAEISRSNLGGSVGFAMLIAHGAFEAGDEKSIELNVPLIKSEQGWILAAQ